MKQIRAAMTPNRILISLLLAGALAGCSTNPSLRTSQATSTDAAQAIDEELAVAEGRGDARGDVAQPGSDRPASAMDEALSEALLPSLASASDGDGRFDINAGGLAAAPFFEALVEGSRYNVVVYPDVDAVVDLRLRDVTVPEVMDVAGELYGLNIERKGRLFHVKVSGIQTRLFPIDYLSFKRSGGSETRVSSGQVSSTRSDSGNAGSAGGGGESANLVGTRISTETQSDFWQDLERTVAMIVGTDEGSQVIVNPGAGLVMVRSDGESMRQVEEYLRKTQLIMQRQVVLEAKILEIQLNEGYQQGVNWSDIQSASSVTSTDGFPAEYTAQSLAGQAIQTADIGGLFSASFREGTFTALIELLGRQGNVQILSSPRISTVNNQKAVIKVGTDEFFVTDIDFQDNNNANTNTDNTSTSVELTPFFSGISLDVTPQIAEDGSIILHVHPAVSEVSDQEKLITVGNQDVTLPLASSTVRETDSVIRAESGQIVVIGGLIQNKSEDNNSAVPFFSDIPILGELFKQRRFQSTKSELVILLRPVVSGSEAMRADVSASRERMNVLREVLESTQSPKPQGENSRP